MRLYNADCLKMAEILEPRSVGLTVTSPPYNVGIPYHGYDDSRPLAEYREWTEAWARALWEVTAVRGRVCLNVPFDCTAGGRRPIFVDCVQSFLAVGWKYQHTLVWAKSGSLSSPSFNNWGTASSPQVFCKSEMVGLFYKGSWSKKRAGTSQITAAEFLEWADGTWHIGGAHSKYHPATFPEALVERCLKLFGFKEDTVLDPFTGSGTTLQVARRLGRKAVGFELSEEYCRLSAARLAQSF